MIYDLEMNKEELQELCNYYDLDYPEVIEYDELYTKLEVNDKLLKFLERDNIAMWPNGDLLPCH